MNFSKNTFTRILLHYFWRLILNCFSLRQIMKDERRGLLFLLFHFLLLVEYVLLYFVLYFKIYFFLTHLVPFNIFWRHSSMLVYNNFPPWNFSLKIVNCFPHQTTSNETIFHFFFINFFIFAHIFSQKLECALFNPCLIIGNVSF